MASTTGRRVCGNDRTDRNFLVTHPALQTVQLDSQPPHWHHRLVIGLIGLAVVLAILLTQQRSLLSQLDSLSSVATGFATLSGLVVVAVRAGEQRREQRVASHRDAWRVLIAAQGKPGSGGRLEALESLARDGVCLDGVDLSGAYLHFLRLPKGTSVMKASFRRALDFPCTMTLAKLDEVLLSGSNFSGANLTAASLRGAMLSDCIFDHSTMAKADLSGATMNRARGISVGLEFATLRSVFLNCADLESWILLKADLTGATMNSATLRHCSFQQATIEGCDLEGAKFEYCSFFGTLWGRLNNVREAAFADCVGLSAEAAAWLIDGGAYVTSTAPLPSTTPTL